MKKKNNIILYLVIPCYNEEQVLNKTCNLFLTEIKKSILKGTISSKSKILFVNDGSSDKTWDIVKDLANKDQCFSGISLSRNFGHQKALIAGMEYAIKESDAIITMDCDGQDDVSKIEEMLDDYNKGYEVVYGVRNDRKSDSVFKKITAEVYYKILALLGIETIYNHADFRLLSNRAVNALLEFKENNLYLRGLVPLVGFKNTKVYYERKKRIEGETHYSLGKMISLAMNGITSFSVAPLRFITGFGIIIAFISFIGVIWSIIRAVTGHTVIGWASMTCIICFVSGIQLLSLGVIGEYIGKIYIETKNRPKYFIADEC